MSFTGALLKPSEKGERRPTASRTIAKGSRYEVLKEKIRGWWDDRLKIGEALREIQTDKLYKNEYPTFDDFCEEEFGLKRTQAYGLIAAINVKDAIKTPALAEKIVNERQTRALSSVPIEQREAVVAEVAETGPITAKAIKEVAKTKEISSAMADKKINKNSASEKSIALDKTGYAIPESILDDWQRAELQGQEWLTKISQIRTELKAHLDEHDVITAAVTNTTLADLNNAYTSITCVLPYAVCTTCQGHQRKKCNLCKGRGFLDKFSWKSFVPAETKKLRGGK